MVGSQSRSSLVMTSDQEVIELPVIIRSDKGAIPRFLLHSIELKMMTTGMLYPKQQ